MTRNVFIKPNWLAWDGNKYKLIINYHHHVYLLHLLLLLFAINIRNQLCDPLFILFLFLFFLNAFLEDVVHIEDDGNHFKFNYSKDDTITITVFSETSINWWRYWPCSGSWHTSVGKYNQNRPFGHNWRRQDDETNEFCAFNPEHLIVVIVISTSIDASIESTKARTFNNNNNNTTTNTNNNNTAMFDILE